MNSSAKNGILIMKFGGTSVGSVDALKQSAGIVAKGAREWRHVVVVVSAMTGITDALLASAAAAEKGDESAYTAAIDGIQSRHLETTAALLNEGIARSMLEEHIAASSRSCALTATASR